MSNEKKFKKTKEVPSDFTGIAQFPSGMICYYKDGKLHREDGPAIEYGIGKDQIRIWYLNGRKHRTDGPSSEGIPFQYHFDERGGFPEKFHLNGEFLTAEEHFSKLNDEEIEKVVWKINEWNDKP